MPFGLHKKTPQTNRESVLARFLFKKPSCCRMALPILLIWGLFFLEMVETAYSLYCGVYTAYCLGLS